MSQHIFIIGASGYVGGTLARHFAATNHSVTGLVRSAQAASQLRESGIRPELGDLESDVAQVLAMAEAADAVIYAAQVATSREPARGADPARHAVDDRCSAAACAG